MLRRARVPRDLRAWNDRLNKKAEADILATIEWTARIARWNAHIQYGIDHPELRAHLVRSNYSYEPPRPIDLQRTSK